MKKCIQVNDSGDAGFSLIEVMVAMMVLSIMVVGAASYQLFATQKALESQYRIQALWIARYMLDHLSSTTELRSLYGTEDKFNLEISDSDKLDCQSLPCQDESKACSLEEYQQRIKNQLLCLIEQQPYQSLMPKPSLSVHCKNTLLSTSASSLLNTCKVEVKWDTPINKVFINSQNNNSLIMSDWVICKTTKKEPNKKSTKLKDLD